MCHRFVATLIVIAAAVAALAPPATAQEFPIAVGRDSTIAMSASFDGRNYLVGIQGDTVSSTSMTAQRVSPTGGMVGARISLGRVGTSSWSGPFAAFDGTNSLLVWTDRTGANNDVYGRFVDPSGSLVGSAIPIAATAADEYFGAVAFGHTNYLVLWARGGTLYGQLVGRSGTLVGSAVPLTSNVMFSGTLLGETAVAFDGTNFFVAWQSGRAGPAQLYDIYGCFVSESGVAGTPFVVSGTPSPRFNPLSVAFNGTSYLVVWNRDVGPGYPSASAWDLCGRLVSPAGSMGGEFVVTAAAGDQMMPSVATGGSDFLVSWTDSPTSSALGRVFNSAGVAADSAFTILATSSAGFPLSSVFFGGHQYLALDTRVTGGLANGDIYGVLLHPHTAGVGEGGVRQAQISLSPPHPNPSTRSTSVAFTLQARAVVSLGVFDLMGREVARLVDGKAMAAGEHAVPWTTGAAPGGVYFVRLQAGAVVESQRVVLLR